MESSTVTCSQGINLWDYCYKNKKNWQDTNFFEHHDYLTMVMQVSCTRLDNRYNDVHCQHSNDVCTAVDYQWILHNCKYTVWHYNPRWGDSLLVYSVNDVKMYGLASFSHCGSNFSAGNSAGHRRTRCLSAAVSMCIRCGSAFTVSYTGFANTITGAFVWCRSAKPASYITTTTSGHSCTVGVYRTEWYLLHSCHKLYFTDVVAVVY